MKENIIDKIVTKISINNYNSLEQIIDKSLQNISKIYSFIVYAKYDEQDILCGWSVQYNISQIDKYNTLTNDKVKEDVMRIINDYKKNEDVKYIIGYGQPHVNLMLELFDPLICKLSRIQHDKWKQLLYEDLCQDCRWLIIELYNKGYYINKRLIEKCFYNLTLNQVKKERDVTFVSLDSPLNNSGEDKELTLGDTIPDTLPLYYEKDDDLEEAHQLIFNEIKEFIIDKYGERAFDQLFRSYANGTTYSYTQNLLWKIKRDLEKTGLLKDLKDRYL